MKKELSRNKNQEIMTNSSKVVSTSSLNNQKNSLDERLTTNISNSTNTLDKKEIDNLKKELSQSNSSTDLKKHEDKKIVSKFQKRKSVMFLAPDVLKLQQMKNKLTETQEEIKSKIKKKNSQSNKKVYLSPVQKRSKNFNLNTSQTSITSNSKKDDSFNLNLINANDENKKKVKKSYRKSAEIKKDILTPLPSFNKKKMEKKDYSKILQNTVMLRRIEFSLKLKRKNLPKIYEESVLKIQKAWKKFFMANIYDKIVKIQSVFRKILFKKELEKLRHKKKKEKESKIFKMIHAFVKNCWLKNFLFLKKKLKSKILPEITIISQREIGTQIGDSFELENKEEKKEEVKKEEEIKEEEKIEEEFKEEEKKEEKKEEIKKEKSYFYPNICLKTFPRPFHEIGIYLNVLLKRINLKRFSDIDCSLQESLIYEGYSGKLLSFVPIENNNNKKKIKYIHNKSMINRKSLIKNIHSFNLNKKENKSFLKNKNIVQKEYDLLKGKKYSKTIFKKINNKKWNYYTKHNITFYIKKINYLQKEIRKYLKETKIIKQNKIQKFLHLKLFIVIFINNLIKKIRKNIISLLKYNYYPNKNSTTFDEEIIENDNERMIPTNKGFLEVRKSLRTIKNKKTNFLILLKKKVKNNIIYSNSVSSTIYNDETVYENIQNIFNTQS